MVRPIALTAVLLAVGGLGGVPSGAPLPARVPVTTSDAGHFGIAIAIATTDLPGPGLRSRPGATPAMGAAPPAVASAPLPSTTTTVAPLPATTTVAPPPATAPPARAAVPKPAPARLSPQAKFEAAAARIRYPWRDLGFDVVVQPGRPGLLGSTRSSPRRITLYVRADESVDKVAFVFAHELGHAVDLTMGTSSRRSAWLAARGLDPRTAWFGCNDCDDLSTPAGDFAESFAAWQVGGRRYFSSRLGPPPNASQRAVLAAFSSR